MTDRLFRYGAKCEQLLFASRQDFHYCFVSPAETSPRWAVCLWADRSASIAFDEVKQDVIREIKNAWIRDDRDSALKELQTSTEHAWDIDKEWNRLRIILTEELRGSHAEAQSGIRQLAVLESLYVSCSDREARKRFLEFIAQERNAKITEEFDFVVGAEILKAAAAHTSN
jgi:hypothetical protein